jgi:hypothetical protein
MRLSVVLIVVLLGIAGLTAWALPENSAALGVRQPPTAVPTPTLVPAPSPTADEVDDAATGVETEPFVRTELFFGSERPDKGEVSAEEFKQFLDEEVTPRFPDGLTLLTGFGQFREASGETVQETSFVLVLLYPREFAKESSAKIEEIRTRYIERFEQESVLRVDDPRPVRVSF